MAKKRRKKQFQKLSKRYEKRKSKNIAKTREEVAQEIADDVIDIAQSVPQSESKPISESDKLFNIKAMDEYDEFSSYMSKVIGEEINDLDQNWKYADWKELRRIQDRAEIQDAYLRSAGQQMYTNITKKIDEYSLPASKYLHNLLQSEVDNFGMDRVLRGLGNLPPDIIERVDQILFYVGKYSSNETHENLVDFAEMIRGSINTAGELKIIGDIMDRMTNYEEPY